MKFNIIMKGKKKILFLVFIHSMFLNFGVLNSNQQGYCLSIENSDNMYSTINKKPTSGKCRMCSPCYQNTCKATLDEFLKLKGKCYVAGATSYNYA